MITYGETVSGDITAEQFFDLWAFEAFAGDTIIVQMSAADGLLPLIGILASSGDVVARSEDGTFNATVSAEYVIPANGVYTIVATRVGRDQGTTTGSYTLLLDAVQLPTPDPYQDVTFRCLEYEVATVLTLEMDDALVTPAVPYRINVYGLDGFRALVRLTSTERDPNLCRTGNHETAGDTLILPDEQPLVITPEMTVNNYELAVTNPELLGTLTVTIGSVDSAAGRYVAVISGLNIEDAAQPDRLIARVGPLAAAQGVTQVYMMSDDNANSRLDPYILLQPNEQGCDDAGRRGCLELPSFAGAGVRYDREYDLIGTRFAAGIRLRQNDLEPQILELGSFAGNTGGRYALVIMGTLPAR
jgi:hypothetical protein